MYMYTLYCDIQVYMYTCRAVKVCSCNTRGTVPYTCTCKPPVNLHDIYKYRIYTYHSLNHVVSPKSHVAYEVEDV